MKRTRVKGWLGYAIVGLIVTAVVAAIAGLTAKGPDARAIWIAAALAYTLQIGAFALLIAMRGQAQLFMMAWLGGMVLRFGVLGVMAYWVSRSAALPLGTTLLSFVGFLFLLLLLEPVFLRWDLRES